MCNPEQPMGQSSRYTCNGQEATQSMTDVRNGHSAPFPPGTGHRQEDSDSERALLESEAEVLTLVDETLSRTESKAKDGSVRPAPRGEDPLGSRVRRSV